MTTPTLLFKRGKSLYSNSALCATRRHVHSLSSRVKQCGSSFNTQRKWFSTKKRILPSTTLLGSLNSISSDTYRNSHSTTHSTTHSLTTYGYTTSLNSRLFSTFSFNAVGSSSSTITPSTTHTHTHTHTHNTSILKEPITKVTTVTQAQQVLQVLYANPDVYWACDTEVADIDVKNVGPVGHGKVTCISMFGGPEIDFGLGEGKGSVLWIENINDSAGLLQEFKEWFEDTKYKKVWHNYGFDRHVMFNEGINCRGFAGDTMHMARLWDTSLDKMEGAGGYSLAALSTLLLKKEKQDQLQEIAKGAGSKYSNSAPSSSYTNNVQDEDDTSSAKESMLNLFGVAKLTKNGQPSKVKILPSVWELQTDPLHREKWIQYSAKDAVCTFDLHQKLAKFLSETSWEVEGVQNVNGKDCIQVMTKGTMYNFYENYLRKFGEVLTDMERNGIKVDVAGHLVKAEEQAKIDRDKMQRVFTEWMSRYVKDWRYVNLGSTTQMQQLFFGHYKNKVLLDKTRVFSIEKDAATLEAESAEVDGRNKYASWTAVQIKEEVKARGMKHTGKKTELLERLLEDDAGGNRRDETIPSITPPVVSADDRVHTESISSDMKPYEALTVKQLQDICTARRLNFHHYNPDTDLRTALCKLIADDVAIFKSKNVGESTVWPNTPLESNSYLPQRSIYEADNSSLGNESETQTTKAENFAEIAQLKTPKRSMEFTIESFGIKPIEFTPAGVPKVGNMVLRELGGSGVYSANGDEPADDTVYGSVYKHFGGGDEGKDACRAIGALANISQVETMISSFLIPLQALADKEGRIHCSLNLNTETGRLSSRKPNLQNQPALEKDQYKIRDAFMAEEGNTLLVADYGQLELRLMAHMTQCRSMLDAFASGGCFHSRTAVGMYPHIQEAIAKGEVLLEWDYSKGDPPKPLVKDIYGSERRKAKTLNFSIAYGKTIHGLAKDWGISTEEAKETLEAWYRDRPEVKKWQEDTRAMAQHKGYVRTMMGRRRLLKEANTRGAAGGHALRAAINTPIQGSAADVVMMAMINLSNSEELKRIGWKLLLQIHDEVILEGPRENKDLAMTEVMRCMQNPFDGVGLMPLSVKLEVDAKTADTWYQAK